MAEPGPVEPAAGRDRSGRRPGRSRPTQNRRPHLGRTSTADRQVPPAPPRPPLPVLEVTAERPAPGGDVVAHAEDGRVLFVRHALPGERVRVAVTEQTSHFLRGEVLEVLEASPDRVDAPCPHARPGGCGGCDLQHLATERQAGWKTEVARDQLRRIGGVAGRVLDDFAVEAAPEVDGAPGPHLGWRTRVQWAVDGSGRPGLHRHRSHEVEPLEACPLAHELVDAAGVLGRRWPGRRRVEVAVSPGTGDVVVDPRPATVLHHVANGRELRVSGGGFWQVHPAAADLLVGAVLAALEPRAGEQALDLYAGAGLFSAALTARGVSVLAVEQSPGASADARRNLAGEAADVLTADVRVALSGGTATVDGLPEQADLVVLDPPRSGAGPEVVRLVAARQPRRVAYVSCDAATLARDLAAAREAGLVLVGLHGFDLFPMTAHLELLAVLEPANGNAAAGQR